MGRNAGRTPDSLGLHYRSMTPPMNKVAFEKFRRLCLSPGMASMAAAYRAILKPVATYSAYTRAFRAETRREILGIMTQRRKAAKSERAAKLMLSRKEKSRP